MGKPREKTQCAPLPKAIGLPVMLFLCLWMYVTAQPSPGPVKRGRSEGTVTLRPSNVIGSGNITLIGRTDATLGNNNNGLGIVAAGQAGIADILQFDAQTQIMLGGSLGPTEAHLQVTTPFNDNMRLFGAALTADLYLSTTIDTVSLSATDEKPLYNPYLFASLWVDADWIALWKHFPLKTYASLSLADNPDLLFRYNQWSMRGGMEWKMYQHAIFCNSGLGFYKEKKNKYSEADKGYEQMQFFVEPGVRYRALSRLCIAAALRLTVAEKTKKIGPVTFPSVQLRMQVEFPLIFKETNTEAIRTLIFVEQRREKRMHSTDSTKTKTELLEEIGLQDQDLSSESNGFDFTAEEEKLTAKREEVQKKMDEIEQMLDDVK